MFKPIMAAQLDAGLLTRHDAVLLGHVWESDPTAFVVALEDCGWWVEMGSDQDPDPEVRATVNEFLLHTFRQWGFTNQFLDVVQAAQSLQYQFVRITEQGG